MMVFLDPSIARGLRRTELETIWRARVLRAELFAGLGNCPLAGPILACDATPCHTLDPIGANFVRVGEASFSLDPLSSTGVEKAVHSGLVAAIALHTMIVWPGRKDLCQRFYRDRQREVVSRHAVWSARFYRQVARFANLPFWKSRSAAAGIDAPAVDSTATSRPDARLDPTGRVRLSREARRVQEPCLIGDEIRAHPALVHPLLDRPVAFVEGMELWPLLEMVASCTNLGVLLAAWSRRMSIRPAQRLTAWLLDKRILETAP